MRIHFINCVDISQGGVYVIFGGKMPKEESLTGNGEDRKRGKRD